MHWDFTFDLPVSQDPPLVLQVLLAVYTACFGAVIFKVTSRSNNQMVKYLEATSAGTAENSKRILDWHGACCSPPPINIIGLPDLNMITRFFEQLNVQWVVPLSLGKRKLIVGGCCHKRFQEIVGNGAGFSILRRLKFPLLSQEHDFISHKHGH